MSDSRPRPHAVFADRRDAGRRLVELVQAGERSVVVALPRGGVPVGFELARALGLPLEVLAVRKLGVPHNPELALGAIAVGGGRVLDRRIARRGGAGERILQDTLVRETIELNRQAELFGGGPPLELSGRSAIVVDDGLATGLTMLAAVLALRRAGAATVTVAVPVGSREALELLRGEADRVVCHTAPDDLRSVGSWYVDFSPVGDEEVIGLLREHRAAAPR